MSASVVYAANRYCTMSRGALHMLARLRDDLAKADPELEGDLSAWAEELEFLHQALSDACDDLTLMLRREAGSEPPKPKQPPP